ncbi:hypothetical protein VIBNIFTn2_120158 [Vibrio nigripulchritudo FTn2]|nr:hypothetical protein VIBNIFTn2_120158 [Vibrio nigripulchritudo FTn2]
MSLEDLGGKELFNIDSFELSKKLQASVILKSAPSIIKSIRI